MLNLHFFKETARDSNAFRHRTLVDVGGHGDCGFRAIAAGIIDNIVAHDTPLSNMRLLETLLQNYDIYFPQRDYLSPKNVKERFRRMISNPILLQQFVRNLAYVLRQIAVDEMVSRPEIYRAAFVNHHENTSPQMMRKESTWIDESAIAALSNVLHLPIAVSVVEKEKNLPLKLHYLPQNIDFIENNELASEVSIQLKNNHYQPKVACPKLFAPMHHEFIADRVYEEEISYRDPSESEIMLKIAESDHKIVHDFEHHYQRLSAMVVSGDIEKSDLLDIYIQNMSQSDFLQGFARNVELNRINFENIIDAAQTQRQDLNENSVMLDDYMLERLIHAIARAMTIGHVKADPIYQWLEDKNIPQDMKLV